jgi:hypothetical protein
MTYVLAQIAKDIQKDCMSITLNNSSHQLKHDKDVGLVYEDPPIQVKFASNEARQVYYMEQGEKELEEEEEEEILVPDSSLEESQKSKGKKRAREEDVEEFSEDEDERTSKQARLSSIESEAPPPNQLAL